MILRDCKKSDSINSFLQTVLDSYVNEMYLDKDTQHTILWLFIWLLRQFIYEPIIHFMTAVSEYCFNNIGPMIEQLRAFSFSVFQIFCPCHIADVWIYPMLLLLPKTWSKIGLSRNNYQKSY